MCTAAREATAVPFQLQDAHAVNKCDKAVSVQPLGPQDRLESPLVLENMKEGMTQLLAEHTCPLYLQNKACTRSGHITTVTL